MSPLLAGIRRWFGREEPAAPREERRVQPRYKMVFTVSLVHNGATYTGRSSDLSQTGIAVFINVDLEVGTQVTLIYELGDGSPVKRVPAIVRNRNGLRYGFEFVKQ
ncbi:MAG TPA: PilZ domain-containing protein [Terriglobales bacterium]|nr:PilZ domain-containing protein [Terriglobales bacterium]